jgi:hypothetical protein
MIGSAIALVLRTILFGWIEALWDLVKALCAWFKRWKSGRPRPTHTGCVWIDHPAFVRPDPLIYSQQYLTAQGLAVTWDNPDIELFKGGVQVSSSSLDPATTYEVRARIWNRSTEAPVVDMPVHLSFLDFGVGTHSNPVGTTKIDVGVLGSPDQPAFATWLWTTPATPGHYCLQVLLDPADDLNPANNMGQENTDVVAAHSPAEFKFTLRNDTRQAHRYRFELDAYQIPALPRCEDASRDPKKKLGPHRRGAHPVPTGFAVQISPSTPRLNPDESAVITVTVDPPAGFLGRQPVNVNAFHEQSFAGGVTLTCVKEV